MNWIILLFFLEVGYQPLEQSAIYTYPEHPELQFYEWTPYTIFDAEIILFNYFFVGGTVKTDTILRIGANSHTPTASTYITKGGIRINNFEAGFRHVCKHPTIPMLYYLDPRVEYEMAYQEIYIRISNRLQ
jgi:hypothetical protein